MGVLACLEGTREDNVGVAVIRYHDVLVTAAAPNREASRIVGIKPADVVNVDVELTRIFLWEQRLWFNKRQRDGDRSRQGRRRWYQAGTLGRRGWRF